MHLKLHFPDDALPTLDTFIKQTKEARVFRRAQAVRNVVQGQRLQPVSDACLHLFRSPQVGPSFCPPRGPRLGRSPRALGDRLKSRALEQHLNRLVDQDPLQHGSLYSQWSCRALATVFARETGVQLGRESIRCALKKLGWQN